MFFSNVLSYYKYRLDYAVSLNAVELCILYECIPDYKDTKGRSSKLRV